MSQTYETNEALSEDQVIASAEAGEKSKLYAERFVTDHRVIPLSRKASETCIAARLQFALERARPELKGLLEYEDLHALLDYYQGKYLSPCTIEDMPDALNESSFECRSVAKKVRLMSSIQRLALADILELSWYRSARENRSPVEIAAELVQ